MITDRSASLVLHILTKNRRRIRGTIFVQYCLKKTAESFNGSPLFYVIYDPRESGFFSLIFLYEILGKIHNFFSLSRIKVAYNKKQFNLILCCRMSTILVCVIIIGT